MRMRERNYSGVNLLLRSLLIGAAFWFLGACSSTKPNLQAISQSPIETLKTEIDKVLADSVMRQTQAGIKIVSLKNGEVLYERDAQKLFHPASNMKLLTTATALSRLGSNFRYQTTLHADSAAIQDSVLQGDLYLKGTGNPDLLNDDLRSIVRQLQGLGVKSVSGNLICDDSYMDDLFWGRGWMWDDASAWYWAPIYALSVEDNCVTVTVKSGENIGDPLQVEIEPNTTYMRIENHGRTVAADDSLALDDFSVQREWKDPANVVVIKGGRTADMGPRRYVIDVLDGALYTGTVFSERLAEAGIEFSGEVKRGILPENSEQLVAHTSASLADVIDNTNKISDNLSAEMLLKTVGAEMRGTPGSAAKGISEIYRFLDEAGVDSNSYYLADGSGVSRYNVVHADLLIALLEQMHRDFRVQAEFKASLPIAGVDGTLSSRMKGGSAMDNLRAKTGSLRGVSSLAGYTISADGEQLAFAILMANFVGSARHIRKVQDRIGHLISDFRRTP